MVNKKAFSFVEIIITISIIALLAVVWFSAMDSSNEKADNAKVVSDIETINNALLSLSQENSELPMPGWNKNFFQANTDYAHSYTWTETYWVYGSITENTIAKKYLDILPLDPRTNSYYSYGKTKETNEFEVAGVEINDWEASAIVSWNYTAENWPYGLIREYNGSNFVYNKSVNNLPYNPNELVLIATDAQGFVYKEWDTIRVDTNWEVYKNGTLLHSWTDDLELFFSDWSVSVLEKDSELTLNKLSFPKENNLTTFVQLALNTWKIWTRATNLNDDSEFEIYTTDSTAAVRWTIFAVSKDTNSTDVLVIKWKVAVTKNDTTNTTIKILLENDSIKIIEWREEWLSTILNTTEYTETIKTKFSKNTIIRTADEIESLRAENEVAMQEKETIIQENSQNCFFNGNEIKNWESVDAYSSETWTSTSDCENKKENRICTDGALSWTNAYSTCTAPTQCTWGINPNEYLSKTDNVNFVKTKQKCKSDLTYENEEFESCISTDYHRVWNELKCESNTKTRTDGVKLYTLTWNTSTSSFDEELTFCTDWTDVVNDCVAVATWLPLFASAEYNTNLNFNNSYINTTSENLWHQANQAIKVNWYSASCINNSIKYHPINVPTLWWDLSLINKKLFSWIWKCWHNFYEFDWETWIVLDNVWDPDKLKYKLEDEAKLKDDEDFKIEMSVRVPNDDSWTKHYLLHSWDNNLRLFIQNNILYFKDTTAFTWIPLSNFWTFQTITLEKEWSKVYLKVWGSTRVDTNQSISNDVDEIYVWSYKVWSSYYFQINDIIDYVKIYKN